MTELDIRIKEVADWCLSNGIAVIPIGEEKKPAIKWGGLEHEKLQEWNFPGCNIAILTGEINNIVVIDCDTEGSWRAWEARDDSHTPLRVKSRRGMHYYYRAPDCYIKSDSHVELEGHPQQYDVKGGGSYCIFSPSMIKGWQYNFWPTEGNPTGRYLPPGTLPIFKPEWRPERVRSEDWESKEVKNAYAYIKKIFAIEGQGGDKQTFKVARILQENGIPEADAVALMCEWNQTNATPAWDVFSLRRKISMAYN